MDCPVADLTSRFPSAETWTIWHSILPQGFSQPIYVMICPCGKHLCVSPGSLPITALMLDSIRHTRVRCLPSWRERKRKKEMNDAMNISSWRFVDSVNSHVTTPWGGMDCTGQANLIVMELSCKGVMHWFKRQYSDAARVIQEKLD